MVWSLLRIAEGVPKVGIVQEVARRCASRQRHQAQARQNPDPDAMRDEPHREWAASAQQKRKRQQSEDSFSTACETSRI
jgi:hypothetical protein